MARPIVTVPPVTILMEMAGYGSLTEWLARPLPREHVAALSPDAKRERKRAQIRVCKANKRRALLANVGGPPGGMSALAWGFNARAVLGVVPSSPPLPLLPPLSLLRLSAQDFFEEPPDQLAPVR